MIGTTVDPNPWLSCDAASSVLQAGTQDWLSCFDFSSFPASSPSTQEIDDLVEPLNLDNDFLLSPDGFLSFLEPDAECGMQQSDGFSSSFEINESVYDQIASKGTRMEEGCHVDAVTEQPPDPQSYPLKSPSSTVGSPHGSDAGSSLAVREGISSNTAKDGGGIRDPSSCGLMMTRDGTSHSAASSRKRHCEDTGSDLDGGDKSCGSLGKKQQRLLRNRELAFESRQRKKCYISDLEVKCKVLEQERNQLQQQLCLSSAENAVLRKELSRVKKMKSKDGVAEPAVLFKAFTVRQPIPRLVAKNGFDSSKPKQGRRVGKRANV